MDARGAQLLHWASMRTVIRAAAVVLVLGASAPGVGAQAWVTAYYTGWRQSRLAPDQIDYEAVTHVVHFAVVPRVDGTLDAKTNLLTPANIASAVAAAHGAGKKILFTVGGQNSRAAFVSAMSRRNRDVFISCLVRFLGDNHYDGIDIDMEEIAASDAKDYAAFIKELRERLNAISPRPLLTAAVRWQPALFARLADRFDQINIMTYHLSGPYAGWVSWHDAPIFDGNRRFANGSPGLPSTDGIAKLFIAAGVPRSKLGVGLSFNGSVWTGAGIDAPGKSWKSPPQVKNVPYYALADAYKITEGDDSNPDYHWDEKAQAAYLGIPGRDGADGQFVSYANATTVDKLSQYAREQGLGGLFVWDLGAGYRAEQPAGRRDPLLQAIKVARERP